MNYCGQCITRKRSVLPRKQAMLRRRGAAASLGDSSKLVECFGGGSRGVSELVVKFVGEGVYVGSFAQGMGLYARCWSFVQPAFVEATLSRSSWSESVAGTSDC